MTHNKSNLGMPGSAPVQADRQGGQPVLTGRPVLSTKLLLVDDDAALMRSLARNLRGYGWACTCSTVPMYPHDEQVALIDWNPHGKHQADHCAYRGVPYVVLTGAPEQVPIEISRHVTVLAKPCSIAEIDKALRSALAAQIKVA